MIKSLKIIRSIIVNVGIIMIGLYALRKGADPSIIGGIALTILGAYNGVEILDYVSLAQAILETQDADGNGD